MTFHEFLQISSDTRALESIIVIIGVVLYLIFLSNHGVKNKNHKKRTLGSNTNKRTISANEAENKKDGLSTFRITSGDPEPRSKNHSPGKWIKPGEEITVNNSVISKGWFYFGGQLPSLDRYESEASLVDESLKAANQSCTYEDDSLGYWPKYISLSENCRGAYLNWLASSRDNPSTPLGYIFIYFYGLERRIVVDSLQGSVDDYEYQAIFNELLRLKKIYCESYSFQNYSTRLLEVMCLLRPGIVYHPELENTPNHDSILFKYRLAKTVVDEKPIPADLALAWLHFYPDYYLKTPAHRCSNEFGELFTRLYTKKYGDGIVVKPNKTHLHIGYYPASSSLRGVEIIQGDLPDPSILKVPTKKLISIAEYCMKALDSYSRYLGKKDTSRSDILAVLLLPEELNDLEDIHGLNKFKKWAEESISKHGGLVDVRDFWEFTQLPLPAKINKKESNLIQMLSEKAGFGLVPDSRFHQTKPSIDGKIVLFNGGHGKHFEPSKEFKEMGMALRLGAMVATINSRVDQAEIALLKQLIDHDSNLSSIEKRSLHSYLTWRLNTPSNVAGLKPRLKKLGAEEKAAVSRILIGVALADGKIDPEEIKQLEKLYTLLGLDKALVTGDIHSMTIGKAGSRGTVTSSEPINKASGGFRLNEKVLAIHESQTEDVQRMLDAIFVDEEPEKEVSSVVEDQDEGIDALHLSLYESLINKDRWSIEEIDEICKKMGLMTSGAIETINDWSFERVDAPVLDEDADSVYVDQEIVKELEN